jgi:hypothetical protein
MYVDHLSGTSNLEEAIEVQQEISALLQTAGFTLRYWHLTTPHFWTPFQKSCKKHKRHYPSTMRMELQHSGYYGIQGLISFRSRTLYSGAHNRLHSEYKA